MKKEIQQGRFRYDIVFQKIIFLEFPFFFKGGQGNFENNFLEHYRILCCWFVLILMGMAPVYAQSSLDEAEVTSELIQMDLDELMDIEVTSASKKLEKLSSVPAAIYVLTQEDIRRSGHTSIAELLRMVPGVQVARVSANRWAITSRGFAGVFSNKLLVLLDGRSVYTPSFAGVYWDVLDTVLDDIKRIEVIRGPGAALWGANAVNGIINIITKDASNTQGGLINAGSGSQLDFGSIRYGANLGKNAHYRVYFKGFNQDSFIEKSGEDAEDTWQLRQAGFRLDWSISEMNSLTFQGDQYVGTIGGKAVVNPFFLSPEVKDDDILGKNLMVRWQHRFSTTSEMTIQLYHDQFERNDIDGFGELRNTFDLDFQHAFTIGEHQEIIWGFGYRTTRDNFRVIPIVGFFPDHREDTLRSAFIQDEITLLDNQLRFTMGTKYEYNDYTGSEFQPSVRLLWTPAPTHVFWAATSRAVRSPSRNEADIQVNVLAFPIPNGSTGIVRLEGDQDVTSEELLAYEAGYRVQMTKSSFLELAVFYNIYDHLASIESGEPYCASKVSVFPMCSPLEHVIFPQRYDNLLNGLTRGAEVNGQWKVTPNWKLIGWYTWLEMQLDPEGISTYDEDVENKAKLSPKNQFQLRSNLDLPLDFELDTALYYVNQLDQQKVPSYTRFDLRLAYITLHSDFSLVLQNLFGGRHLEFISDTITLPPIEVEPGGYAKVSWRF